MNSSAPVWEEVTRRDYDYTDRLVVPGGWLYRNYKGFDVYSRPHDTDWTCTMTFVPTAAAEPYDVDKLNAAWLASYPRASVQVLEPDPGFSLERRALFTLHSYAARIGIATDVLLRAMEDRNAAVTVRLNDRIVSSSHVDDLKEVT